MSLLRELTEQQNQGPVVYFNEWSYQHGFGGWKSTDYGDPDATVEDASIWAQDEWGVEGSEVAPGIWVGINFTEPELGEDKDESGPYTYEDMEGVLVIAADHPIPKNHPIFAKAMKEFTNAAEEEIDAAREEYRESSELRHNPHAFYGVKRSDFS